MSACVLPTLFPAFPPALEATRVVLSGSFAEVPATPLRNIPCISGILNVVVLVNPQAVPMAANKAASVVLESDLPSHNTHPVGITVPAYAITIPAGNTDCHEALPTLSEVRTLPVPSVPSTRRVVP